MANPAQHEGIMSFGALTQYRGPGKRDLVLATLASSAAEGVSIDPAEVIRILRRMRPTIENWRKIIDITNKGAAFQDTLNGFEWRDNDIGYNIAAQYEEVGAYAQKRLERTLRHAGSPEGK